MTTTARCSGGSCASAREDVRSDAARARRRRPMRLGRARPRGAARARGLRRSLGSRRSGAATGRTAAAGRSGRGCGSRPGTPPARCPRRARCRGRRGRRRGAPRPVGREQRLEVRGGSALGTSHPGALVPACMRHRRTIRQATPARGPRTEIRRWGRMRSRDLIAATGAYRGIVNDVSSFARRAASSLAVAPRQEPRLRRGGGFDGARDGRSRVARRRARPRHADGSCERIRTLPGPRSIESAPFGHAVVAHTGHGLVSVLDSVTLSVRSVLRGFVEPRYTAMHPSARLAYVTDSGRRRPRDRRPDPRDDHRSDSARSGPARHLSVDPDGRRLWTALGTKAERIAVCDLGDPQTATPATCLRAAVPGPRRRLCS